MITKYLHIKTFVGFLFLLLAAACSNEDEAVVMPSSNESMKLQVTTVENALTRSDGVKDLNENLFVTLDYYFFASADEQEQLKLLKSETGLTDSSEHTYDGKFSDEELEAVFGDNSETNGAKCYVYVVANLTVDKLDANAQAAIAAKSITLGQLMRKEYQTTDISKNEAQDSFVMYGGDNVTLSITTEGTKTKKSLYGQIKVKRDAAKVVLTVTDVKDTVWVATESGEGLVTDEDGNKYSIWKSDTKHMYVMFYNGVNKSTIHSQINQGYHYTPGRPDGSIDNDCYFTLDNTDATSDNPWRNLVAANSSEPNKNLKHEIPFYTYLSDWSASGVKERASYMILMVPWQQVDANGDPVGTLGFQNTYYQIETTPTNEYAYYENTFYQILINVGVLGSFVKPEPVEVSAQYMIVPWGNVDIPGTLREGRYLILETKAYTVNNQSSGSIPYISSHKITQAYVTRVEWLALKTFASQNRTNTGTASTWTTNTYVNNERFDVSYADNKLTLNHTISPDQYTRYNVTVRIVNEAGLSEEAVFTIYPAIYASNNNGTGRNSFINGYFGHVSPTPPSSGSWQSNGGNPASYRVRENTGGNPTHIWAGGPYNYDGNNPNPDTNTYGSLITAAPGLNETMTRITVTSFTATDEKFLINVETSNTQYTTQEYTYKLTDPRVPSGWTSNDLHPYVVTTSSRYNAAYTTQSWTDANKIMVGTAERDKIAPEFLVTSSWGRCNPNSITFAQAQKRCATYQEDGYPAGRWRLPTVAECSYIYTLQQLGVIENLFNPGHDGGYWTSEGYAIRYRNGHPSLRTNYTGEDPVRCVYDIWYWGDEPMSTNEYHAMPTKNNN